MRLDAMAAAFGVSPDFMDGELANFIVAGRLPAKIDKVAGVVETSRCRPVGTLVLNLQTGGNAFWPHGT